MIKSRFVRHHGIAIHVLDSKTMSDPTLPPLVISPGLSETAEEYMEFMHEMYPRRCIVLSYRGRGRSDTPERGYGLAEHVTDLQAVISEANLPAFHLMGHSRGVSYVLGYALNHNEAIRSLVLEDYPAEHKKMPESWAEFYIRDYLIPAQREAHIRQEAVRGIERESTQLSLAKRLNLPVLILRGMQEGSMLTDAHMQEYESLYMHLEKKNYPNSGHDIRNTESAAMVKDIQAFLARADIRAT
ncbi:hydrolase [Xylanibacillus composti]|uniref:Hydrolase n=1 Tax=Xylanibacillus composti TaxID=1572762 RepID=A0A8J4H6X2_9BACL|nr:alpha/beta hydrolase [Xylanibacillus composti]GIQ69618.1 hydrolase [Xylanibacillus composti]